MSDQVTRGQLRTMSPAEVTKALREGRMDSLMSGDPAKIDQAEAIAQLREAQAMAAEADESGSADQGARNEKQHGSQWTALDLSKASPAEVLAAMKRGDLSDLLAGH